MASVVNFPRREIQAMGLIGAAHLLSHVYLLALAPLLIPITSTLHISTVEWGTALGVFAIATGVLQTPMGFLVERIGGRKVLIGGLLLNATAFCLMGWQVTGFWQLLVLMALAGIGNSVFHPADYSLISSSIDESRLGRAYSIHTFVGHVGFLAGPVLSTTLEPFIGWRGTMVTIGALGITVAILLMLFGHLINEGNLVRKKDSIGDSLRDLLTSRPVLLFFLFYMGASMANFGVTQFSVAAFQGMHDFSRAAAVAALTAYQLSTLFMVLPGGLLADRTDRYDAVLVTAFGISAVAVFLVGADLFPFWLVIVCLVISGGMRGAANASRDVSVRHVASHLPVGTVFGFVSTGFLVGQALGGPIYGWLFDNFPPHVIFYASAVFSVLSILTVLFNTGTRRSVEAAE